MPVQRGLGSASRARYSPGMPATASVIPNAAPFLRWAGGKRWLLRHLTPWLANFEVNDYHEPFLGAGSVFFGIRPKGTSYLSDLNSDLIETYQQVKDDPKAVADRLLLHPNEQDHYYTIRSHRPSDPTDRAARFIYLNHTSFNGIYRVNLKGQYNVPFGNRTSLKPPTEADLGTVSTQLQAAVLNAHDFKVALQRVRTADLVFLDPPYTVAHNTNGFVKYNQKLFSFDDQRALRKSISHIKQKGAYYILTNAAHQSIRDLFGSEDQQVELSRRSSVAGNLASRGRATELMYTNIPLS